MSAFEILRPTAEVGVARSNRVSLKLACVNAGEKIPDFAGLKFPLSGKKIY